MDLTMGHVEAVDMTKDVMDEADAALVTTSEGGIDSTEPDSLPGSNHNNDDDEEEEEEDEDGGDASPEDNQIDTNSDNEAQVEGSNGQEDGEPNEAQKEGASEEDGSGDDSSRLTGQQLRKLAEEKDATIAQLQEALNQERETVRRLTEQNASHGQFEKKAKQQQLESSRKENILIMRLTLKEQELQECLNQIDALKQLRLPTSTQLQSYLLDPALNYMFEQMKKEVDSAKTRVEEMQSELNAWKFSADSVTGKRLMAKCRQLHQENEELGKMISSGKIAKLEGGLAMSKNYSEELKKSQSEIEEVLMEMEEDIEGFQNTVYCLQQQLKEQKDRNAQLEEALAKVNHNQVPSMTSPANLTEPQQLPETPMITEEAC